MRTQLSHFDVLFRNLFDSESDFNLLANTKAPHPLDLYEDKNGLVFEIACVGLTKEDVNVNVESDILKISYTKATEDQNTERVYQIKNIARRSFNLAYKISPKFDLSKLTASLKDGLLVINIPFAEQSKPRTIQIK